MTASAQRAEARIQQLTREREALAESLRLLKTSSSVFGSGGGGVVDSLIGTVAAALTQLQGGQTPTALPTASFAFPLLPKSGKSAANTMG